jgi:ribosomal 50S subunit-associated protein YjgA (DUF615 family)
VKIEGTLRANLLAAIASARRLKGEPVHEDTLQYWGELLKHARSESQLTDESLAGLADDLEAQLAARVQ